MTYSLAAAALQEVVPPVLAHWESYYVILGSSGAALTGLQFVVIALIAESRQRSNPTTIGAFGTPTIVHFCSALFVAAVLSAPWRSLGSVAWALCAGGLFGIGYSALVTRRAMTQTDYKPVLEDWVWHTILPFVAYTTLFGSSLAFVRDAEEALFPVAGAVLLLLFIGIHNAWDTVTYLALARLAQGTGDRD